MGIILLLRSRTFAILNSLLNQLIYESERLLKFIFKIKLQPFTFWMTILALKLYSLVMFKSEAKKSPFFNYTHQQIV